MSYLSMQSTSEKKGERHDDIKKVVSTEKQKAVSSKTQKAAPAKVVLAPVSPSAFSSNFWVWHRR